MAVALSKRTHVQRVFKQSIKDRLRVLGFVLPVFAMSTAIDCSHARVVDCARDGCIVCASCGVVIRISMQSQEWRCAEGARGEAGSNFTTVGPRRDFELRAAQRTATRSRRGNDDCDFSACEDKCVQLGLSDEVWQLCVTILRNLHISTSPGWRSGRRVAVRAACISLACDRASTRLNDRAICTVCHITSKALNRQKKAIICVLHASDFDHIHRKDSVVFARTFCNALGFDVALTARVQEIVHRIMHAPALQSKSCETITAVAIMRLMLRSQCEFVPLLHVCKVAEVTLSTICKWYTETYDIDALDLRNQLKKLPKLALLSR